MLKRFSRALTLALVLALTLAFANAAIDGGSQGGMSRESRLKPWKDRQPRTQPQAIQLGVEEHFNDSL
ncbi:uncharacterized protein BDW47DRAFT_102256 [Aspergillus candidus]|uniref:Uncharacterized protein n=1 Tax=Aspergillus candidus TaxID=41067 RepID=A0A2I2FHM8_ASPCN|nr:hypothetical protein BDW47DRAFT_102256 [Aspergillus candidus]PLB40110.1 hypothetical protein BDW47DRAFT_102256 [Aspergillus candidus]